MTEKQDKKMRPRGRPPRRDNQPIPDTFANVLEAMVRPSKPTPDVTANLEDEQVDEKADDDR